jgi:DNA primase
MPGQATYLAAFGAGLDISALKARTDIVEIVGRYATLERRGAELWARCPFHNERTPSFKVDQQRQRFICFGCGRKGDVLDFLAAAESLDGAGAIRRLREIVGSSAALRMPPAPPPADQPEPGARRNRELAQEVWRETEVIWPGLGLP